MQATFEEYCKKYESFVTMKREDGILEMKLHSNGDVCRWDGVMHSQLGFCFADVGSDQDNKVVILTATGDRFIDMPDMSVMEPYLPVTPQSYMPLIPESTRLLQNLLDIEAPIIAAVNGPAPVHPEFPALADICLAADRAWFSDGFHFQNGWIAGDGTHVVWPLLLGHGRAQYFMMTAERISAAEAKTLGFVNEVLPADQLNARAWELARQIRQQPEVTLRAQRMLYTQPLKRALSEYLPFGLALEGLGEINYLPLHLKE
ncbi:enoyl-CoA hydratase/isomerase family protein [Nocardia sp. NPDC005745]|uniref:enoyl-CoA hydratase/isomerase family protein n=1 Tax=Nocardia sp. NPDC005745 TaxID=3157061 RepID=UPI0033D2C936